jgi:hypothetical protein
MSYFTHQEILWAIALVLGGFLMVSSYNIEYKVYTFNSVLGYYVPTIERVSYPFLMAVNLIFSALSLILGLFDIFDKYVSKSDIPEVGDTGK